MSIGTITDHQDGSSTIRFDRRLPFPLEAVWAALTEQSQLNQWFSAGSIAHHAGGASELSGDPPWRPWRPEQVAARLAGVRTPWYVAAGWAVDLFLGRQTREHGDLEIAVPEAGFTEVRQALPELEFHVAGAGRLWPEDDTRAFRELHQTWARDPATGAYCLDVFREPHDGDTWICRRDPAIRMPYRDLVAYTADGIPYQRPDVVLLFKAKHARDKDDADLANTLPLLDAGGRAWLRDAVTRLHPGHRWLDILAD